MMNMLVKFLGHLWGHWEWLMGLLLMIEPLIDYHVEGFRDWADKFVPRKTRTRIAVTVSGATLLVACFLAFNDEYAEWQKDEALIHGKGGYEQQLATLNSRLADTNRHLKDQGAAIEGHNGYKDQLSSMGGNLQKAQEQAIYWQQHKPQVVVQERVVPVVIPSGTRQMTPEEEARAKKTRLELSGLLLEGIDLANALTDANEPSVKPLIFAWMGKTANYVEANLDHSYTARFIDMTDAKVGVTKPGISGETQQLWTTANARITRLNQFITELSR